MSLATVKRDEDCESGEDAGQVREQLPLAFVAHSCERTAQRHTRRECQQEQHSL